MIKMRRMEKKDLNMVISLGMTNLSDSGGFPNMFNDFEKINFNVMNFYVVEEDDKIIGHISLQVVEDTADILFFFIDKEYRNKGIGSYVLKNIENSLKERLVKKIILEVRKSNLIAQRTYVTNGYHTLSIRKEYYQNGEDAYVMYKKVGSSGF